MTGDGDGGEDRIAALERRIAALEARVGISQTAKIVTEKSDVAAGHAPTAVRLPPPLPIPRRVLPVNAPETEDSLEFPEPQSRAVPSPASTAFPQAMSQGKRLPYASKPPVQAVSQGHFERTVGLKWAGWAGALVLVVGAALGVKFVYEQRWLAHVPPWFWLGCIFAGGLGLIAAGEWVYRRVNIISAASVFGAGVATLFLGGYALVLMTAAAVVGALVAMRGNLVSIAVLSSIGGTIAPLLARSGESPLAELLVYLLALQAVAMFLAFWGRGRKWWTLRGMSLAGNALWVAICILRPGDSRYLILGFSVISALLYHAELLISVSVRRAPGEATARGTEGSAFCISVIAALTASVLWATRSLSPYEQAAIVLLTAAASMAIGWLLAKAARRRAAESPETPQAHGLSALSIAYRICAAALLAGAVPTALRGISIEIGWAIQAIAFAFFARLTGTRIARYASIAVWELAIAHLALNAAGQLTFFGDAPKIWLTVFGTAISSHAIMAWSLAIVGQLIAALLVIARPRLETTPPARNGDAMFLSTAANLVWVIASLLALPSLGATGLMLVWVWVLAAFVNVLPGLKLSLQAAILLLFAAGHWAVVDSVYDRFVTDWIWTKYHPVLNAQTGLGLLLAFSMIALHRRIAFLRASDGPMAATDSACAAWLAALVMLILTATFEIDRTIDWMASSGRLSWPAWQAKSLCLTMAWIIPIIAGFVYLGARSPNVGPTAQWPRLLPLAIELLAIKYLAIDTLAFRLLNSPARVFPLANLEAGTGAIVLGALIVLHARKLPAAFSAQNGTLRSTCQLLIALVVLWMGSLEIDRYFSASATRTSEHVALSIYWAALAVGSVIIGFGLHSKTLRYFSLLLLAITLLKVVLIDMSEVNTGYRILSFIGLGLLLLATSVLYGKLSPNSMSDQ